MFYKIVLLKFRKNLNKNTWALDLQLYQKVTPVLVFSWEFYEIFENNFFKEHPRTTASKIIKNASQMFRNSMRQICRLGIFRSILHQIQ